MLLRRCDLTRVAHLHVDVAQGGATNHTFHRAGVRHDDDVVLIHTLWAQAFGCQHTGNRERHIFDAQNLADGTFVSVNLRRGGAANNAHFVRAPHVLRREWRAVRQWPLSNIKVIRRLPENPGEPVLISGGHLRSRDNFFAYADHTGHFAPDRLGIFDLQRAGAAPAGPNTTCSRAPGKNQNHIFSEAGDLCFHLRLRAIANPDHRNDCADADDDTQRG